MGKFKVGDRVYCVDDSGYTEFYVVNGAIYTVVDKLWFECESDEVSIQDVTEYHEDFKLYKEEPIKQFDMHTQPWFIRVNNEQEFHLVQEWLKENFGTCYNCGWHPQMIGLTNTTVYGEIYNNYVMWFSDDKSLNQNSQEIKLKFKTTIDSVEWPVVESEKDKKIRELKEIIEAAAKQIEELENM